MGEELAGKKLISAKMERGQKEVEQQQQQMSLEALSKSNNINNICYCPSRWLMAHHDSQANIFTLSSHICLADLNNDGENVLALIDFKQANEDLLSQTTLSSSNYRSLLPYNCRLRVYRGQQLIYNHFLDDIPSGMFATSTKTLVSQSPHLSSFRQAPGSILSNSKVINDQYQHQTYERVLLTLCINDDVYFYDKLKASSRLSLQDDDVIVDSMNKSEFDAWQMVKQNKVDIRTMFELLKGLENELGSQELSSHSMNFLNLKTDDERKNYLLMWKFKKSLSDSNNHGRENLMSMDTICCAAARLRYPSNVTCSGNFGQTRETGTFINNARWNRILDIQRDGLILGTEDRHLLIYEIRSNKLHQLEAHYKLPASPDFILVERRSPSSFDSMSDLNKLTYKILVSCRNCRIYSIDQKYLVTGRGQEDDCENNKNNNKSSIGGGPNKVRELISIKCNVLDMCWSGDESQAKTMSDGICYQNFIAACLDKRVYCFSSHLGHCIWVVELEMPITCIISLPIPTANNAQTTQQHNNQNSESNLIGVASKAERVDFYISSSGRIVDTIYFSTLR